MRRQPASLRLRRQAPARLCLPPSPRLTGQSAEAPSDRAARILWWPKQGQGVGDLVLIGCARGLDAQAESWRLRQPHRLGLPAGGAVGPHRLPAPDRSGLRRKGPIRASLRPRTGSEPAFRIARHGSGLFRVPASSLYGPFGYSESAKWAGQWSGHGAPTLWPLAAAGITKLVMGAPRPATQDLLVSVYRPRVRQR